jgi:hypothetical protein
VVYTIVLFILVKHTSKPGYAWQTVQGGYVEIVSTFFAAYRRHMRSLVQELSQNKKEEGQEGQEGHEMAVVGPGADKQDDSPLDEEKKRLGKLNYQKND